MTKKEKEATPNIYTQKKLLSFPTNVNNNNNSKKTKHLECSCWVCKILDSSSVTNDKPSTTMRYEPYNIVSETGYSIFYDPLLFNIFNDNDDKIAGEIYVSEIAIEEVVNRIIIDQKRVGSSINNNQNGN
jgi:hypothetical protein